ncbi:outer membrane beta-barrel protein [Mucilaginibacter mali]|uniref:Outer membrane beta-barrel protein n=1 Tax=Mucilaginibacter mali TaxID=2740462 RepID=A0A7D4Q112_9SPHI|nr:outer membrane beta-barrel protein [Mucilaginibacter mali]QKJ30226.1 outer membrane beta-barrel protein [Mucilaginibacter mali]
MKKILLLSAVMLVAGIVSAQKVNFGARLRYTDAKLMISAYGMTRHYRDLANVDPGVFADINFGKVTVEPGLLFALKGGALGGPIIGNSTDYNILNIDLQLYTLELPVNILYNIPLKPGKIFIGGGPYAGYAVSGKYKGYTTQYTSPNTVTEVSTTSTPVSFGSFPTYIKRFDFGLNGLAGFRLNNGFEINIGMGFGLANVVNKNNPAVMHNRTISAGIGYFFK